ncbi:MAG: SPOR domain-containing protein [Gammaproteobacteria bacterium]
MSDYVSARCAAYRVFSALVLSLFISGVALADRAQALQSESQGNYAKAAKSWLQLANEGDPLAQYNLALLYRIGRGVIKDSQLYKYWLSMSARSGFAEAYILLNNQAVQPTNLRVHIRIQQDPGSWLAAQNPSYYTLQLASSTRKAQIQKYYEENGLAGKGDYYVSRRSGEDWYSLVYGVYPTVGDAKAAIDALPAPLKKWSPWVRNIKSIQRIMVR